SEPPQPPINAGQRRKHLEAIGAEGRLVIDDLHLIPFKHRQIAVLPVGMPTAVFGDDQAWLEDLDDQAVVRNHARGPPDSKVGGIAPLTKMETRPLDGRGESREAARGESDTPIQNDRIAGLFPGHDGERNLRYP